MKIVFKSRIRETSFGPLVKVPKISARHVTDSGSLGQVAVPAAERALCKAGMSRDSRFIAPDKLLCEKGGMVSTFSFEF